MLIIPAIDLKNGQCVRLKQGRMNEATIYDSDPIAVAKRWVDAGARRLHIVDLDGAFAAQPINGEIITAIAKAYPKLPMQIGGGIRDAKTIEYYLKAGVSYVIIGTAAAKDPDFVSAMCRQFAGHIIVGIDAINGLVATEGWADVSTIQATELAKHFAKAKVSAIVFTDINRDGMMRGVNLEATVAMAKASPIPVIASGGIHTIDDVKALQMVSHCGILGVITGRAIYEGTLNLTAAQQWCDQSP